jgi:hypothetical protein
MNPAPPHVVPILATPFGVVSLPGAMALNAELATLFQERARTDASPAPGSTPFAYESGDDLNAWTAAPVPALVAELQRGVRAVAASVNPIDATVFAGFELQSRGTFAIVRPDGALGARSFPLTSWCGVYCVAAPAASTTRRDSGLLRLYESRLGTMFSDASNSAMQLPYTPGHFGWRPVPGQLAVFPAWLTHEVAMLRAPGELVLVTVRCRFVAPGQQGWSRW